LRYGEGYIEGTPPQDRNGVLTGRAGDTHPGLGKTHNAATKRLAHASLLVLSH
jgi:hypothetical protein